MRMKVKLGEFDSQLFCLGQREVATACAGKKIGSNQEETALLPLSFYGWVVMCCDAWPLYDPLTLESDRRREQQVTGSCLCFFGILNGQICHRPWRLCLEIYSGSKSLRGPALTLLLQRKNLNRIEHRIGTAIPMACDAYWIIISHSKIRSHLLIAFL